MPIPLPLLACSTMHLYVWVCLLVRLPPCMLVCMPACHASRLACLKTSKFAGHNDRAHVKEGKFHDRRYLIRWRGNEWVRNDRRIDPSRGGWPIQSPSKELSPTYTGKETRRCTRSPTQKQKTPNSKHQIKHLYRVTFRLFHSHLAAGREKTTK